MASLVIALRRSLPWLLPLSSGSASSGLDLEQVSDSKVQEASDSKEEVLRDAAREQQQRRARAGTARRLCSPCV